MSRTSSLIQVRIRWRFTCSPACPKMPMSTIDRIVYQPVDREYEDGATDFIRVPVLSANLVADFGIENDRKAGHNPRRQLNLLSREWLDTVAGLGFQTGAGQFGEQLTVSGLPFNDIQPGTQLQLGDEAVIEVTQPRTGCSRLEAAQGRSIAGIGPIGLLARVVIGGEIRVGDEIVIRLPAQT